MRRPVTLVFALLVGPATAVAAPAPAQAVVPGFNVAIIALPGEFAPGQGASAVTAVASTDQPRCQKVRWSMVLRVDGLRIDQVRVDRIEDSGSFPLSVQTSGNTARLTDVQFDPGNLCRGRNVTARYRVAVSDGAPAGRVTLSTEVLDRNERLLQQATATRDVVAGDAAGVVPPADPGAEPAAPPADGQGGEPPAAPGAPGQDAAAPAAPDASADDSADAAATVPAAAGRRDSSLLLLGISVGALLIFLGVGLLLRLRTRARRAAPVAGQPPAQSPYAPWSTTGNT